MSGTGTTGVLIAAGRSRRMGRQKLLLPWPPPNGPSTVLAAAFDLIRPHCDRMIIVLGDDSALETALEAPTREGTPPRAFITVAGAPDGDMFDSVRRGLEAARGSSLLLLQPADHPAALDATITRVLDVLRTDTAEPPTIACLPQYRGRGGPQYRGRGGHPVAIRGDAIDTILAWRGPDGLAGCWRHLASRVVRLPVDDPSCIRDLDHPDDYRALP